MSLQPPSPLIEVNQAITLMKNAGVCILPGSLTLFPPPSGALILFPFTKIVQLNSHRSYYMTGLNKSIIHSSKVLFKVSDSVFQPY